MVSQPCQGPTASEAKSDLTNGMTSKALVEDLNRMLALFYMYTMYFVVVLIL